MKGLNADAEELVEEATEGAAPEEGGARIEEILDEEEE